jgi:nitrite reductase/ring-hydroxylating ferredoxin subunit
MEVRAASLAEVPTGRGPWHGWMYDVRSGQCLLPARGSAIATYPVRIEGDEIWIEVP